MLAQFTDETWMPDSEGVSSIRDDVIAEFIVTGLQCCWTGAAWLTLR